MICGTVAYLGYLGHKEWKEDHQKPKPKPRQFVSTDEALNQSKEQELDRTRKALDKAIWWLKEIVENHRFTPISTAEKALAEINEIKGGK